MRKTTASPPSSLAEPRKSSPSLPRDYCSQPIPAFPALSRVPEIAISLLELGKHPRLNLNTILFPAKLSVTRARPASAPASGCITHRLKPSRSEFSLATHPSASPIQVPRLHSSPLLS